MSAALPPNSTVSNPVTALPMAGPASCP
jgi:hypothetical protein